MKNSNPLSCSATFGQVISEAAVDVLGQADAACLAMHGECGVEIHTLITSLQQCYGPCGSKGVAQRMGQAAFKYFLNSYGNELNLTSMDYHLLPSGKRLKTGLEAVSRKLGEECGTAIRLDADEGAYYWHITSDKASDREWIKGGFAYFLAGMAQELLSWSGGGRFYNVREVPDAAACVLKMDQRPLD
jgi:hypothetical protein